LKLLHTADWQLGLRLNFVGGDAAARLRAQRFETVRGIGAIARQHAVDAVVVAGDVFDDNGVGGDTLQQTRDALEAFGDVPVILLPGNHDPATPDSALRRLNCAGGNVHVASTREAITLGGHTQGSRLTIFPCPLMSRHVWEDPAGWLPAQESGDEIRVVLAHGSALDFAEADGDKPIRPNRIDLPSILARGYDYVALGDWHGLFEVGPRAWYPGAPEATRFKEKRPGHVLLVEIDAPGAVPRIEAIAVARSRWLTQTVDLFEDADLDGLEAWLEGLDEKSWTLVQLVLRGQLSLDGHARLEAMTADFSSRLAALRVDTAALSVAPTAADLAALCAEGYLGRAVDQLRAGTGPEDADALRLLYRLMKESA
jgi:DNA repair exonuclease SbcCD nuclease subunit